MTTLTQYTRKFAHYLRNIKAVSALEYALLIGLIATVIAAAIVTLGGKVNTAITTMGNEVLEAQNAADD